MDLETDIEDKIRTLADYLNVHPEKITPSNGTIYSFRALYCGTEKAYLVLNDTEADTAARNAVSSKLWLISLDSVFNYFDIDRDPVGVLDKLSPCEIKKINSEFETLFEETCGIQILAEKMLNLGNRANILADHDQEEIKAGKYFIYRLF